MKRILDRVREFTEARRIMAMGLYPYFRPIESEQGATVTMDGREVVMMGSNNYLGLTNHPEVKKASQEAIDRYGTGCAGSRFLNGTLRIHMECEAALAHYMRTESALVYSTGFTTNQGVIASLTGRDTHVFIDRSDHASIIDAVRLSFGKDIKFNHNDMEDLEKRLQLYPDKPKMIVIDGVFSMEGDIAPLDKIAELAETYDADVLVDDAHAIGVLGDNGRGTASHFGVEDKIAGTIGTFSKSLASIGGFFTASEEIIHYLKHHSRALIFSASPPPASMAAVIKAIEIIEREPERIERLWTLTNYLKKGLEEYGFNIGHCETPIIPVYVGDNLKVFEACIRLQEEGVFVNPVVAPAVPADQSLLRLSLMSTLTEEHLDFAISKLVKVGEEVGFIEAKINR
ncbi:aminotransferase class I/II-fold pyridoxal phosphate-dependent enzyme [bacterium]|nr:aminotransferase class I/II-fold pyridoxal phosphate-dependent enzyme [bacterium]